MASLKRRGKQYYAQYYIGQKAFSELWSDRSMVRVEEHLPVL